MREETDDIHARHALDAAPVGVLFLREERIVQANRRLCEWLAAAPASLTGLTPETAVPLGLAVLFGTEERLTLTRADREMPLRRRRESLPDGCEVHFFEDLSEWNRLERERDHFRALARTLETKDQETGLLNRSAILQALENQVSRSRRYGNPLSAIRLFLEPPAVCDSAVSLRSIAQELNAELRWADQIGRLEQNSLLLILPETERSDAEALASQLGHDRVALARAQGWHIDFAADAWQTGDDARKLLQRLDSPRQVLP